MRRRHQGRHCDTASLKGSHSMTPDIALPERIVSHSSLESLEVLPPNDIPIVDLQGKIIDGARYSE